MRICVHRLIVLVVPAFLICVARVASADGPCADGSGPEIICTSLGAVKGIAERDMLVFKGIPYARPPLGALRWRPPQPPSAWSGVRDGSSFGPVCPQVVGADVVGDEDCLTLNIWTPRQRGRRPLPVMVYLTGGGNHSQSGQGNGGINFTGSSLVPTGVLLITVNIRLGALGFLAHPSLDAEDGRRVSGNYGSQDHIAMLRWVKQNITAFGGDPNRVFLFGTSAGGANICGLMTSPLARGLFHGGSMESSVPTGCVFHTLAQAESSTGTRLVAAVGCDSAVAVTECLRGASAKELVRAVPAVTNLFPRTYGPVVDGYVFPDQPLTMIATGRAPRIPIIIGSTSAETVGWVDGVEKVTDEGSYSVALARIFGVELRDRVLMEYPQQQFVTPREAFLRATTDALFTCATRRVAEAIARAGGGPVYRYLFAHTSDDGPEARAGHSSEHPFLFYSWKNYSPTDGDRRVSEQMVGYWTRMAKSGNPNGGTAATWPPVTRRETPYLEIRAEPAPKRGEADTKCAFWDSVTLPSPHL